MTWRQLLGPCAFGHAEPLMTRNASQQAVWTCSRCLAELGPVLASEVTSGPMLHQGEVLGQPTAKAQRSQGAAKVAQFGVRGRS